MAFNKVGTGVAPQEAEYYTTGIPIYDKNPLIQALGPLRSMASLARRISVPTEYIPSLRVAANPVRFAQIGMLSRMYLPTTAQTDFARDFYENLRNGLVHRSIQSTASIKEARDNYHNQNTDGDEPAPDSSPILSSSTFIGVSGMGKTRTIARILDSLPQVIWHPMYFTTQLVFIRVETPQNSSEKAFVISVHAAIDRALGQNKARQIEKEKYTQSSALTQLKDRMSEVYLGIIVIDEIQHALKKSKDANDNLLSFLVNFVNEVGVPVYLVGTLASLDAFTETFRMARRSIGEIVMNLENGEEFENFLTELFIHQYTKETAKLTKPLLNKFYKRTQGILALVVLLFQFAQKRAIDFGNEKITSTLVDEVADDRFKVIQNAIDALATKNLTKLCKYEDLFSKNVKNLRETIAD